MQKILIIEDDPFLSEMYAAKFNQAGFEVGVAADGQEGLEKIEKERPDLILLDIVLPKADGFDVLEKIKKNPSKWQTISVKGLSRLFSMKKILAEN